MALDHLDVPAADENPMAHRANRQQLPATRPTLKFPVVTHTAAEDAAHACLVLLGFAGCCLGAKLVCVLPTWENPQARMIVIIAAVVGAAAALRLHLARHGPQPFLGASVFATFVAACFLGALLLQVRWAALGLAVCAAASEASAFRRHYLGRAVAGMHSLSTVHNFLRSRQLPPGLRRGSMRRGFYDAITSYLTYNRKEVHVPGVWQSPAGKYGERLARTAFLLLLLTLASLAWMSDPVLVERWPHVAGVAARFAVHPLGALGLWLAICFLATCNVAGKAFALKATQLGPAAWSGLLERLRSSSDSIERNSIWLGFVSYDGSPILYPLKSLFRHAWIVGKTGSGKTAYLMMLLDQLLDRDDLSVVFLDLKAMSFEVLAAMQHAAQRASQRQGVAIPVKHFTLDYGQATYLFDIFAQAWWRRLPAPQRAGVILSALALAYSRAYGQSYYTDSTYDLVLYVLQRHPELRSWAELRQRLEEAIRFAKPWELSDEVKRDGGHVVLIVKRLAALTALNDYGQSPAAVRQQAIDFGAAFQSPRHFYFALGAIQNGLIAGEVGRLIAAALLNAAVVERQRSVRVVLVIDEFQEMVVSHLSILLTQARALGIGVILANQTTSQLITPDCDLRPIIEGNTSLQAWIQISDDIGREQMKRLGGQRIVELVSRHVKQGERLETSYTYAEHIVDRVPGTLVSAVSSDPQRFMLRLTDNEGYACYGDLLFVARTMFHQTQAAYAAECAMPWPAATAATLVNADPPPSTFAHQRMPVKASQGVNRSSPAPSQAAQTRGQTRRLGSKKPPPANS